METMWAIKNNSFGFYTGTWLRRKDAIKSHIKQIGLYPGRYASRDAAWRYCRKKGDRVVRVTLIEIDKEE